MPPDPHSCMGYGILKLRNGLQPDIKCHNRSVAGYCSEHIPE
ncbi:hypothetical protein PARMER_01084 [Parabacteroides merdae ATCC 43184]|nr:hypothetical protein PARMER_01084 [Parabacteroides merdae ATCC 43184]